MRWSVWWQPLFFLLFLGPMMFFMSMLHANKLPRFYVGLGSVCIVAALLMIYANIRQQRRRHQ